MTTTTKTRPEAQAAESALAAAMAAPAIHTPPAKHSRLDVLIRAARDADDRMNNGPEEIGTEAFDSLRAARDAAEAALRGYAPANIADASAKLAALRSLENFDADTKANAEAIARDLQRLSGGGVAQPADDGWEASFADFVAASEKSDALADMDEDDPAYDVAEDEAAFRARSDALERLLNTRAPNIAALALKAETAITEHFGDARGDRRADNPAFLSHLMSEEGWPGHIIAAMYQDALALSGYRGPLLDAREESFDGVAALRKIEEETGERLSWRDNGPDQRAGVQFSGPVAQAAFAALASWEREEITSALLYRHRGEEDAAASEARRFQAPGGTGALIHIFTASIADRVCQEAGTPDAFDAMRQQMRDSIRAIAGFMPAPERFDAFDYMAKAGRVGLFVRIAADGPYVVEDTTVPASPERTALVDIYHSLTHDQRLDLEEAAHEVQDRVKAASDGGA